MTADLREAFHTAAVRFVGWHRINDQQRWFGWRNSETGMREYVEEPTVEFFGRDFPITEICWYAKSLDGPLPLHIEELFIVIDGGTGEPIAKTYPEAVELLEVAIECERSEQEARPLSKPSVLDFVRDQAFREGAERASKGLQS
ncbi:hypothetical protein ACFZ8E_06220 [Methylobacterium sp. HMF5984]|uniref:hypothetical protein n=1 Tax=Methylobacterium sp. HMF5984 TaxID=3367370 RepID=UPI0038556547